MTDKNLIQSCLQGNADAEKQLFFKYAGKVLTLCRRYVTQETVAQDLMQDCFIKVFEKIHQYDSSRGEFGAWLHRVCTNVALSYLRKEKRSISISFPEILPDYEEEIEEETFDDLTNEALLSSIRELPEGYRRIVNFYIFEGLKHREIAEQLNITEGTSRSQYTRAKRLLKSILEKKTSTENWYHEG